MFEHESHLRPSVVRHKTALCENITRRHRKAVFIRAANAFKYSKAKTLMLLSQQKVSGPNRVGLKPEATKQPKQKGPRSARAFSILMMRRLRVVAFLDRGGITKDLIL